MKLSHYVWILPFISFLCGYQLLSWLYRIDSIEVPHLMGTHIQDAFVILSKHQLTPSLVNEKEDNDLPSGTIISQSPQAGTKVKPNQSIFIVVSKHATPRTTPNCINKDLDTISKELKTLGIRQKSYYVSGNNQKNYCIGQFPSPGELLPDQKIITYICSGNNGLVLMPDLRNKPLHEVIPFLQKSNIKPDIIHQRPQLADHQCNACVTINQRPLPGSIVTLSEEQPLHVQLMVCPT